MGTASLRFSSDSYREGIEPNISKPYSLRLLYALSRTPASPSVCAASTCILSTLRPRNQMRSVGYVYNGPKRRTSAGPSSLVTFNGSRLQAQRNSRTPVSSTLRSVGAFPAGVWTR